MAVLNGNDIFFGEVITLGESTLAGITTLEETGVYGIAGTPEEEEE